MKTRKVIKSTLLVALLVSALSSNSNIKASIASDVVAPAVLAGVVTVATAALTVLGLHFTYQNAQVEYHILKRFQDDPYYDYEKLKNTARNLYYDQCNHSSTSLYNDYPVVWLEKRATAHKNTLWWIFFSAGAKDLRRNLDDALQFLRNFKPFINNRKIYNEKYREQRYRDDRLAIEREKVAIEKEKVDIKREERRNQQPNN